MINQQYVLCKTIDLLKFKIKYAIVCKTSVRDEFQIYIAILL